MATTTPADLAAARYALANGWDILDDEHEDFAMGNHGSVARESYDLLIGEVNWEYAKESHDEDISDGRACGISSDPAWCPHCTPGGTEAGTIAAIVEILDADQTRPPLADYPRPGR
ncbi:hypothetical protein [Nocardioides sp.]|uniref:hypothetical protein n=1 Tax=Nocardioides sp. TaxID=35761 RepID=UPI002BFFB85B|nr:hypothetical protein [Nocardioides sp.]HXH78100.1 hypothetical protein [Nocardioides sp.]